VIRQAMWSNTSAAVCKLQVQFRVGTKTRAQAFTQPQEISSATDLSRHQKVELLRRWEQDLREQITASREGMQKPDDNLGPETRQTVRAALRTLGGPAED
jgi:hypothetical protein